MSELTLKVEYINMNDKEFEKYLSSLKGIIGVKINPLNDEIHIKYNSELITIEWLLMEVKLFLNITSVVVRFDKHSKQELVKASLNIEDACCEYCLKGFIEDLLLTEGIELTSVDLEYVGFFNVLVEICYDKNIFDDDSIKDLGREYFNS